VTQRLGDLLELGCEDQPGLALLTLGVRVDCVVNRLVRDVPFGVAGRHRAQCPGSLSRRPPPAQQMRDDAPQGAIGMQLVQGAGLDLAPTRGDSGRPGFAAREHAVAGDLPTQAVGAAPQRLGNRSKALPLLTQARQRHAFFFRPQLSISGRRLHTLPVGQVFPGPSLFSLLAPEVSDFSEALPQEVGVSPGLAIGYQRVLVFQFSDFSLHALEEGLKSPPFTLRPKLVFVSGFWPYGGLAPIIGGFVNISSGVVTIVVIMMLRP
jgi:hypothetical protein